MNYVEAARVKIENETHELNTMKIEAKTNGVELKFVKMVKKKVGKGRCLLKIQSIFFLPQ